MPCALRRIRMQASMPVGASPSRCQLSGALQTQLQNSQLGVTVTPIYLLARLAHPASRGPWAALEIAIE
jgi:hypothetical protein